MTQCKTVVCALMMYWRYHSIVQSYKYVLLTLHTWWRHQMETYSAKLALCAGNSPVPVNSPHKGQWRGALMFSLIYIWINGWVNNREAGDLRRHQAHCDVIVMKGKHYNDTIMSAMASRITSLTIIYPTFFIRRRSRKTSMLRVTGLCEGNSPVTSEFPMQRASNAENV